MDLPEGLISRPLLATDLDDLVAVANAYDVAMIGEPDLEKADVEGFWNMASFDLERDSRGVFSGSSLVGYSQVFMGKYIEVCVLPDRFGLGIGSALGAWAESRLKNAGVAKAFQSAPTTDKDALRIFAERGYELAWTSWVLSLPAEAAIPRRPLEDGYEVRQFIPGIEDEAAYEVVQVAFGEWPERERTPYEDWRAVVFDREGFGPEKLLVATFHGEIVGVCYVIDGERAGWVQNVAVYKEHRNHGLAQELLATAFEGTRSRGLERAELATDSRTGALGLYQKLGMHVTQSYEDWSLAL